LGQKAAIYCRISTSDQSCERQERGKRLGRQLGQRPKSDRLAPRVLAMIDEGLSYRAIGKQLDMNARLPLL
jgi:DNA invertase Pin-like site-specific DNA recombinase